MSLKDSPDRDATAPSDLGGDPPCWAHLFPELGDLEDRADVERLVRDFYRDVAMDDVLGPVFAQANVDWPAHLEKLADFWMWQLFGEHGYDGLPLRAHEPVHAATPFTDQHYERWLELFDATVDDLFRGTNADFAKRRARRMARALQRLLEGGPEAADRPVPPDGLSIGMRSPGAARA